jgi:Kef-type K+ transport system membrane component KefB
VHEPDPTTWDFFILLLVVAILPFAAQRLRLPGLLGLLFGGFLIGSNGLGILTGDSLVESVGHIGLLYLMFMAGLDLDLAVFKRYRRAAVEFGGLTFIAPFALGALAATWLGLEPLAAVLMGSVWASHTLVTYPIVRRYGLATDPAVAVTVGATVITDTLSLLVLAVVAGAVAGTASGAELLVQLGLGLAALLALCFIGLVFVTRRFFASIGHERTYRFVFLLAGCIGAASFSEIVGIEGIVGAFFAGLALNPLVPNGSPLMERVEFFGSALFVPAFLVSVGLVVDPSVMTQLDTIITAAVFVAALIAGKGLAAIIAGRRFGFSSAQVGTMFSLSLSQAAATLAATTVGAEIGLFSPLIVNAVIIVIVVSLTVASITTGQFAARVAPPAEATDRIGAAVVIGVEDLDSARRVAPLAKRLADADGGLVVPAHVAVESDGPDGLKASRAVAGEIDLALERLGLEAPPSLRVAASLRQGLRNAIAEGRGSLLILERAPASMQELLLGGRFDEIVSGSPIPVLVGALHDGPIQRVLVPLGPRDTGAVKLADTKRVLALAERLRASGLGIRIAAADPAAVAAIMADGTPTPTTAPGTVDELPAGGRVAWVRSVAQPGDLALMPASSGPWLFGLDATRMAGIEGVSVAILVGPLHGGPGVEDDAPSGTMLRGTSGPLPEAV